MGQDSKLNSLHAFNMIRSAAKEYNDLEFKFYAHGYFKYKREGNVLFIEDIYVVPELRGTPASQIQMEAFHNFMVEEKIIMYYGLVMKNCKRHNSRIKLFTRWGMRVSDVEHDLYTIVTKMV